MKRKNNNDTVCHMTNPLVLRAKGKSFIAFLLVLILVIFSGGCVYGDTPEESGVDLLGIKVLSRPLSYDYNGAVPESASEDDRGDDLDQAYAASELKDYPYATFFLDAVDGDGFHAPASEYQSFVFMPLTDIEVSDLWLDFKYDANNDGNELYDPNLYLDIEVHYRYFNGETVIYKVKNMRVYDGPPDPGEDSTTLEAELFTDEMFGENIKIGPFENPDPINTAINHDEGVENTLTLTGFTEARKYYELIDSPTYGGYGVLNHELFSTPYFEIAFAVRKTPGDTTTNTTKMCALCKILWCKIF